VSLYAATVRGLTDVRVQAEPSETIAHAWRPLDATSARHDGPDHLGYPLSVPELMAVAGVPLLDSRADMADRV